jgi:hypothetical protein
VVLFTGAHRYPYALHLVVEVVNDKHQNDEIVVQTPPV